MILALPPRAGSGPRGRLARGAAFAAGVASMLAVLGAFNLARFGSLAATGYEPELGRWTTPAATGILGLVASPGRGLLTHFPLALLAVVLTPVAFRRSPHWTLFTWGSLAILVLVYCRWHAWEGGWCWGPRFLVPILPFPALIVAPALEGPRAPLVARAAFAPQKSRNGTPSAAALKQERSEERP